MIYAFLICLDSGLPPQGDNNTSDHLHTSKTAWKQKPSSRDRRKTTPRIVWSMVQQSQTHQDGKYANSRKIGTTALMMIIKWSTDISILLDNILLDKSTVMGESNTQGPIYHKNIKENWLHLRHPIYRISPQSICWLLLIFYRICSRFVWAILHNDDNETEYHDLNLKTEHDL